MQLASVKIGEKVCWKDILSNWRVGIVVGEAGYEIKGSPAIHIQASNGVVAVALNMLS